MAEKGSAPNNYRPPRSMVRKYTCYVCDSETESPEWREGGYGCIVPLCPKCVRRRKDETQG